MTRRLAPIVCAAALLLSGAQHAQADTISFDSATLGLEMTSWDSLLSLQQFNPALGQLQSVTLTLTGDLFGSAFVESRNNTARTLQVQLGATLTLSRPDGSTLLDVVPLITETFNAARFDGTVDYAGSSGTRYTERSASSTASASFGAADDLALFTGTGSLALPIDATGNSRIIGPGNFFNEFSTLAGGRASITYTFEPAAAVPEPQAWLLLATGLGAMAVLRRRRPGSR